MSFNGKPVRGVLLDITGVLMESCSVQDTKLAIPGSVEAVQKLIDAGAPSNKILKNKIKRVSHKWRHMTRKGVDTWV